MVQPDKLQMIRQYGARALHAGQLSLKYGTTGQATDDKAIWRKRFTCWTNKLKTPTQNM
jgi:hypothetical protein